MDDEEMLSLLPVNFGDLAADEKDLQAVIPGLPENYFPTGVKQGWCNVTDISKDSVPLYRIYWQLRGLGSQFFVMASLYIGDRFGGQIDTDVFAKGSEMVARKNNAKSIAFVSRRRGHIEQALRYEYHITGITMEKKL